MNAQTPYILTETLTSANTEYEISIPQGTQQFQLYTKASVALRIAYETGKVAGSTEPFLQIDSGNTYFVDKVLARSLKVYVACGTAGTVVHVHGWS